MLQYLAGLSSLRGRTGLVGLESSAYPSGAPKPRSGSMRPMSRWLQPSTPPTPREVWAGTREKQNFAFLLNSAVPLLITARG